MAVPLASALDSQQFRRYYQRLEPLWKDERRRASTAAVFSFLAAALFGWYAIRPTIQTIIFLRREIADKTVVNQQMEEKITNLIEAQANYSALSDQLTLVTEALTPTPEVVELARQLRNLASVSGASVSAIQTGSVPLLGQEATPSGKTPTSSKDFNLTVVLTAPYNQLLSFLEGLVDMRRLVTIETLEIKPTAVTRGGGPVQGATLQLVLKLKAYYTGL